MQCCKEVASPKGVSQGPRALAAQRAAGRPVNQGGRDSGWGRGDRWLLILLEEEVCSRWGRTFGFGSRGSCLIPPTLHKAARIVLKIESHHCVDFFVHKSQVAPCCLWIKPFSRLCFPMGAVTPPGGGENWFWGRQGRRGEKMFAV